MSLTLKITSLVVRTAAKPIGNWIKGQARQHETFRRLCVTFAQRLHRLDMRLRLGLLQDPAAIDRQIAREQAEAERLAKKKAELPGKHSESNIPWVPTEQEMKQIKAEEEKRKKDGKNQIENKVKREQDKKEKERIARIRPLSESKAIDSGANFISETFLFLVAVGLIGFETWRSRRKDKRGKDALQIRMDDLEGELDGLLGEKAILEERVEGLLAEVERLKGPKDNGQDPEARKRLLGAAAERMRQATAQEASSTTEAKTQHTN